jgi:hypothetical protein
MLAEQVAVGSEVEDGVVDGGAVRFPLVDADHEVDAGIPGGGAEPVGDRAWHGDGLVDEHRVPGTVAVPDRLRVDPDWVARDEHLGKHHDAGATGRGLREQLDRLGQGGLLIHQDVASLHRGDRD